MGETGCGKTRLINAIVEINKLKCFFNNFRINLIIIYKKRLNLKGVS